MESLKKELTHSTIVWLSTLKLLHQCNFKVIRLENNSKHIVFKENQ